jgi:ATP-dependent protease Clp ATPase subunit
MIRLRRLRCSFCRKNNDEVLKLVAGPRVYICDGCVAIASRIMSDDSPDDSPPAPVEPRFWQKLSARVRQLFDRSESRQVSSI